MELLSFIPTFAHDDEKSEGTGSENVYIDMYVSRPLRSEQINQ